MSELKSCPFCRGGVSYLGTDWISADSCHARCFVRCYKCGAYGPDADSENESISAWNARTSDKYEKAVRTFVAMLADAKYSNADSFLDAYADVVEKTLDGED